MVEERRVALYLQDKHQVREELKLVQYAEKKGFEAIWHAESRLARDAITPLAAMASLEMPLLPLQQWPWSQKKSN